MYRLIIAWQRMLVFVLVLSFTGLAAAQEEITPIEIGHNLFSEITVDHATARFALAAEASQTIRVQILSLSSDYFPTLRVISEYRSGSDPGGDSSAG